jgi:hypothetical protein
MNEYEYQDFDKTVVAVLSRPKTQSVLRIEIDNHSLTGTSPAEMAQDIIKEYGPNGWEFDGYELRVN